MKLKIGLFVGLFLSISMALAQPISLTLHTEHVVWNKMPISFVVPLNQERLLSFPESVALHNVDQNLTSDKVRILNNDGTLYIKAKKVFSPIRLAIKLKKSGTVILVDLSSKPKGDDTPVSVVLNKQNTNPTLDHLNAKRFPATITMMMRYGIQQLYAPKRLLKDSHQIHRVPMYTTKSVRLIDQDSVIAMPLISWRSDNFYVTAVFVKNILKHTVTLKASHILGKWIAISFYPFQKLQAAGKLKDRTTIFLVSSQPFNESLEASSGDVL